MSIDLNVDSQSKGRAPNVFVFNPFAEGRIAQGKSFTPVQHQARLARDLENLPQFFAGQDDLVLVERRPSAQFLETIKRAGFALPQFVELEGKGIAPGSPLTQRKLGSLRPWAWGPDSVELFEPLFAHTTGPASAPAGYFNAQIAQLYSKAWSADFLRRALRELSPATGGEPWLCTEAEVGVTASSVDEALRAVASIRQWGHHKLIVKEAIGLAGHNAIRLWEPELLEAQRRWLAKALENGHEVVVEPWLERELDFSVQFEMGEDGLKSVGHTGLVNDLKGQYQGNWAEPDYPNRLPSGVAARLGEPLDMGERLFRYYGELGQRLAQELLRVGYRGPVGIDAFVYRAPSGVCRLKPIVEINPRYTMGRLTLELMTHTCPGSYGWFHLVSSAMLPAEGYGDFRRYARAMTGRFPLRLEGEPVPRLREGALCLTDFECAQACLALFQVSRTS